MAAALIPTPADSRTNATFEEMMWALSRPGLVRILPEAGLAAMAESLLDNECSYHEDGDEALKAALARTGARPTTLSKAEYVFAALDNAIKVESLAGLRLGSLNYPDNAATVFAAAKFGLGTSLRLTGPGVKDSVTIAVDGVDPSFWQVRTRTIRYPLGWDVYFIDDQKIIGIPRSTKIEVL